jgi:hypothetical protein
MVRNIITSSLLLAGAVYSAAASAIQSRATGACSAEVISKPSIVGAEVTSLTATVQNNFGSITGNNICFVTVTITHPGTGDNVTNWVALPLTGWNGVFLGIGGGGYSAGNPANLAPVSAKGYSAVSTDAGHTPNTTLSADASPWALISPGNVNQYLLLDFARQSYHDMTIIGKAVTQSFYGSAAKHSYWQGCSTGGRQGLVMAQYYPDDYDGIVANAPAIQWNDFTP